MIIALMLGLGLIFGSFVNACVWRLHEQARLKEKPKAKKRDAELAKLSIVHGRSMCPHCKHELAAKDLVPIVSWLWLKGRCRYCGARIEDTPLPEIALPLLYAGSYYFWPLQFHGAGLFEFVLWLVFLLGFMVLAVYDLRWFLLPNVVVYPLVFLAAVQVAVLWLGFNGGWSGILGALWGVVIIAGMFYALFQFSGGAWIGGGDVKLGIVLGLLAGGPVHSMAVLFVASCSGLVAALPAVLAGKAKAKSHIPFGPFLIFGLIIVQLFGSSFIAWYTRLAG